MHLPMKRNTEANRLEKQPPIFPMTAPPNTSLKKQIPSSHSLPLDAPSAGKFHTSKLDLVDFSFERGKLTQPAPVMFRYVGL